MPFTAELNEDRKHNTIASCAHLMRAGTWENMPWAARTEKCLACPLRFRYQPTCSLDFMTIGSTDELQYALGEFLDYASTDPPWSDLPMAIHEVKFAYAAVGLEVESVAKAIDGFVRSCVVASVDSDFWKQWNYIMVEGFDGKPVKRNSFSQEELSPVVKKIIGNITEPTTYWGERLSHLHAAASIIYNFAFNEDRGSLAPFSLISDASRAAILGTASLKIS